MFYSIIVDSWDDVRLLCDQITRKTPLWAFRGQSDQGWDLSTRFERESEKYGCDSYWFKNREIAILRDFQRKAHRYIQNPPAPENYIEWLSLIQHYGGPTRLLDFTYSYYVAAFFAMETSVVDSVIWGVNINRWMDQLSKVTDTNVIEKGYRYEGTINLTNHWAEAVIKERRNTDIVYVVEPFQQHERISIQQGLFLFPGNIENSFEYNLCSVFELDFKDLSAKNSVALKPSEIRTLNSSDISIMKIVIPYGLHARALTDLFNMNLTAASLFPGLDGFARSLSYHFRYLEYLTNRPME